LHATRARAVPLFLTPDDDRLYCYVPLPKSFATALPALTSLRLSSSHEPDVSGLTGLRHLEVRAESPGDSVGDYDYCAAVKGLSRLTALEDLRLTSECWPLAEASDLAPLTALTRLAMTALPLELGSQPSAARLRRLELQAFGALDYAPEGAAAAALSALARGAPLLERLVIREEDYYESIDDDRMQWDNEPLLRDHPGDIELGDPLGAGVAWPNLTHLQATPWVALLLAGCKFPRLSRLVAGVVEGGGEGAISNARLRTVVAALAAKARDHVALRVNYTHGDEFHATGALTDTALPPSLRHLSWRCRWRDGDAAAPPASWARLAASLESLELVGPLSALAYAEPLAALTGLTRLHVDADAVRESEDAACPPQGARVKRKGGDPARTLTGGAVVRAARALATLPRLAHLRLTFEFVSPLWSKSRSLWGSASVAAELARCPALRLLEVDRRDDPLWRGPTHCGPLRISRPSPEWTAFAQALRAGGCGAALRPAPEAMGACAFSREFGVDC
jgi:hypothetical protein